ncbi:hypothetical protein ATPR_3044 [Acetobacter tropicalis NBRC 101654]|uniref:Uncharacterized protein n=1 Tax=Acetobacter tropicalis NBRC 101654 TaxID=749388 RepID=F7VI46_9PROT|nr:hypothetical protein ATPR_3044 [Acetobacter tropicalis NBRC 101654]
MPTSRGHVYFCMVRAGTLEKPTLEIHPGLKENITPDDILGI